MAVQYEHKFKVRCRHDLVMDFPIDMLRYDSAYPYQSTDATKIERAFQGYSDPAKSEEIGAVALVHIGSKLWKPTDRRWETYGWPVVAISTPRKI